MRTTRLLVLASALLCSGCSLIPRDHALPDPKAPHRLAKPASVVLWVRRPDGTLVQETIRAEAGWWVATPEAVQ